MGNLLGFSLLAQEKSVQDTIYHFVEEMPEPIDGYPAFYKWLAKSFKMTHRPPDWDEGIFISFIVEKDGRLNQLKISGKNGKDYTAHFYQTPNNTPVWQPGRHQGKPCRVKLKVRVLIRLN